MDYIGAAIDDREVRAVVAQLIARGDNTSQLTHEIGQRYERRVLDNFNRESDPEGNPWPRLSAATLMLGLARSKRLKKSGALSQKGRDYLRNKRLLIESGRLMRSIHYQSGNSYVRIGVPGSIPYGAIHQFGGEAGRGRKVTIPARPYLAMNDGNTMRLAERDRVMVLQISRRYLETTPGIK